MPNHNKANHNAIEAAERQKQALELRKAGVTFQAIADKLGYADHSGAHRAISKAIAELPREAAEEVRALELERLDRMMLGLYEKAIKGHEGAVDRVLKIMARRASLLGLDHAPKGDPAQPVAVTIVRRPDGDRKPKPLPGPEPEPQG